MLSGITQAGPTFNGYKMPSPSRSIRSFFTLSIYTLALPSAIIFSNHARAEYGDVVMNNYSDIQGIRPVVFPHWFHRIRFACKVCHTDLGFKFKAGGNDINMVKIVDGQYCGACHNGSLAWSVKNCNLCHSGKPGTETQVHESISQELAVPSSMPVRKK